MTAKDRIRILHVSMLGMPLSGSPGFKTQLSNEWRAARSLQASTPIDWRTVLLVPASNDEDYSDFRVPVVKIHKMYYGRLARRFYLWKYVRKAASQYDVILVRHSIIDPFESLSVRRLANLAIVHHTKDVEELQTSGRPLLARVESALRSANRRWGRWPIGVTPELAQYATGRGCKASSDMVLPNGIELIPLQTTNGREGIDGDVSALFVASEFATWHGLDRLLSGLEGWTPQNDERFTLHLVGRLTDEQRRAVAQATGDRVEIMVHGTLSLEEIAQLSGKVDVGIGSLALDRKSMKDACTLKVREYLAAGLPVYATHRDSGLPDDFPYFHRESDVNIAHLVTFAMNTRTIDRTRVRLAAEPYISKESIMRRAADGMLREIRDYSNALHTAASPASR